jgi:adenylate kinase
MIIVLTGAPGAGKGTQADLLVERDSFTKISTGDALRRQVKNGTQIGKEAAVYMEEGRLVPDDVLLGILKAELVEAGSNNVILDGYPRNLGQAKTLNSMSEEFPVTAAIHLDVPNEDLVRRISGRRVCGQCSAGYHVSYSPPAVEEKCDKCDHELVQRPDDTYEKVLVRLEIYEEQTKPVLDYYEEQGKYRLLDGNGTTEEVYQSLKALVASF